MKSTSVIALLFFTLIHHNDSMDNFGRKQNNTENWVTTNTPELSRNFTFHYVNFTPSPTSFIPATVSKNFTYTPSGRRRIKVCKHRLAQGVNATVSRESELKRSFSSQTEGFSPESNNKKFLTSFKNMSLNPSSSSNSSPDRSIQPHSPTIIAPPSPKKCNSRGPRPMFVSEPSEPSNSSSSRTCVVRFVNSKDLKQPLYIYRDELLRPKSSTMILKRGDAIVADCCKIGKHGNINKIKGKKVGFVNIICEHDRIFKVDGENFLFASVQCEKKVESAEWDKEGGSCESNKKLVDVGFLTNSKNRMTLFSVCIDTKKKTTLYSIEYYTPINGKIKNGRASTYFRESTDTVGQKTVYGSQIEPKHDAGHLTPKANFQLQTHQEATNRYINTAPQVLKFNRVNWRILEKDVRNKLNKMDYDRIMIITGTYSNWELKNQEGKSNIRFLDPLSEKVPVPRWFFKIIHPEGSNDCIVYLGLNDPSVTAVNDFKRLVFCSEQLTRCPHIRSNIQGFITCCDYNSFNMIVYDIPSLTCTGVLNMT